MVITRTPFRISFFDGGTDYPLWFAVSNDPNQVEEKALLLIKARDGNT